MYFPLIVDDLTREPFGLETGKSPVLIRPRLPNATRVLILQFAFRELSCTQLDISLAAACSRPIHPSESTSNGL